MELPNGSDSSASARRRNESVVSESGCGRGYRFHLRPGYSFNSTSGVPGNLLVEQPEPVSEPTAEQLAEQRDEFERNVNKREYRFRWLCDGNGRTVGFEEQWELNREQLGKFLQQQYEQE